MYSFYTFVFPVLLGVERGGQSDRGSFDSDRSAGSSCALSFVFTFLDLRRRVHCKNVRFRSRQTVSSTDPSPNPALVEALVGAYLFLSVFSCAPTTRK